MILQFKNKHIFFALESIWENVDYRFKSLLHTAISLNSDEDYMQELEISKDLLLQIYSAVAALPEGLASNVNTQIKNDLFQQLTEQAEYDEEDNPTNEAAHALAEIAKVVDIYAELYTSKVANGKGKILA